MENNVLCTLTLILALLRYENSKLSLYLALLYICTISFYGRL